MRTLDKLIESLEFGLERAESENWSACTIMADKDGWALLEDLKKAKAIRDEQWNDMDFDYYIEQMGKIKNRSNLLWAATNGFIFSVLVEQQKKGKTLDDAADILDSAAGKPHKREPVSICNIRTAAEQIRARKELVLI